MPNRRGVLTSKAVDVTRGCHDGATICARWDDDLWVLVRIDADLATNSANWLSRKGRPPEVACRLEPGDPDVKDGSAGCPRAVPTERLCNQTLHSPQLLEVSLTDRARAENSIRHSESAMDEIRVELLEDSETPPPLHEWAEIVGDLSSGGSVCQLTTEPVSLEERTKSGIEIGAILVLLKVAIPSAVTALTNWYSSKQKRHIRMQRDSVVLDIQGVSAAEARELIQVWLEKVASQ
jgi:hypothetical protein